MFWKMKKKYKTKQLDYKVSAVPKKSKKADMRQYSSIFFTLALSGLIWAAYYGLIHKTYVFSTSNSSGTPDDSVVVSQPNSVTGEGETINILSLSVEQIEGLANTIAGQNAIWPGYKGDPKDHRAVQRHFNQQFAKFINSGIISVQPEWQGRSVAFAYAVSNDGIITFVGKIPGGTIQDDYVYVDVMEGISGKMLVTPAQDEGGENIIMLYYIKVKFAVI